LVSVIISDSIEDLTELLFAAEAQLLKTNKLIANKTLYILKVIFPISYFT
jgi:hypothetical protein